MSESSRTAPGWLRSWWSSEVLMVLRSWKQKYIVITSTDDLCFCNLFMWTCVKGCCMYLYVKWFQCLPLIHVSVAEEWWTRTHLESQNWGKCFSGRCRSFPHHNTRVGLGLFWIRADEISVYFVISSVTLMSKENMVLILLYNIKDLYHHHNLMYKPLRNWRMSLEISLWVLLLSVSCSVSSNLILK